MQALRTTVFKRRKQSRLTKLAILSAGIFSLCSCSIAQSQPPVVARRPSVRAQFHNPEFAQIVARERANHTATIPGLVQRLDHPSSVIRTHAATDLGLIGPRARAAVATLQRRMLTDENKWVRRASAKALGRIGDTTAAAAVRRATHDRDPWVAHSAVNALKRLQGSAGSSVEVSGSTARISTALEAVPMYRARGGDVHQVKQ